MMFPYFAQKDAGISQPGGVFGVGWGGRNIGHVDCKQKRMRLWERCYMLRQVVTWKDVTCCVKLVVFTWTDVTCFAMGYGWS